jgi:hypothetical protein
MALLAANSLICQPAVPHAECAPEQKKTLADGSVYDSVIVENSKKENFNLKMFKNIFLLQNNLNISRLGTFKEVGPKVKSVPWRKKCSENKNLFGALILSSKHGSDPAFLAHWKS